MMELTQAGAVVTITLPSLEPLTRHDIPTALRLRDAVRDSADSDEVKAIVITCSGSDFCAPVSAPLQAAAWRGGAARRAWHAAYSAPSGLYQNIAYCKKFVVTAVVGRCAGAGSMLVLCSDATVCDESSTFAAPFAELPESSLVLAALSMRLNRAKSWMLGGRAWTVDQAVHAGLVNRAVTAADVLPQAQAMALAAARMPLDGVAMTKVLFEAYLDTQGVGQDFDMAGMHADALRGALLDGLSPGREAVA